MGTVATDALSPETSESWVCAPGHSASPVVLAMLGWKAPCLCQYQCSSAISGDEGSDGAVPRGPGEAVLGAATRQAWAVPEMGINRGHQLVSDLCFVFNPAYLYSS